MEIVGGGGGGEKSLCFVRPDVKDWLVFSCIVTFLTVSLINGMRGSLVTLVCYSHPLLFRAQFGQFTLPSRESGSKL